MKKLSKRQEEVLERIIDFSGEDKFFYINDATGSIRWLFPASSNSPLFLALYNPNNLKGDCYKILCAVLFKVNLKTAMVSGCFNGRLKSYVADIVFKYGSEYAIFTGTLGEDRKIPFAVGRDSKVTHFIKVAITDSSKSLIANECDAINCLGKLDLKNIAFPQAASYENGVIVVTNIKPPRVIHSTKFLRQHFQALSEVYGKTARSEVAEGTSYFQNIKKNIDRISSCKAEHLDLELVSRLMELFSKLKAMFDKKKVVVTRSHGDFTPWNLYVDQLKLHAYDWEFSCNDAPILFDFFHFVFQTEVLINRGGYSAIKKKINQSLNRPEMEGFVEKYQLTVSDYFSLYVVYTVSCYYAKYLNQEKLHMQAGWLMAVWKDALTDILQFPGKVIGEGESA